jgi:hypothetical protein
MISIDELANTTPVNPPTVNRKIKPRTHRRAGVSCKLHPWRVAIQLKILTPVGMAMIIVAAVK